MACIHVQMSCHLHSGDTRAYYSILFRLVLYQWSSDVSDKLVTLCVDVRATLFYYLFYVKLVIQIMH